MLDKLLGLSPTTLAAAAVAMAACASSSPPPAAPAAPSSAPAAPATTPAAPASAPAATPEAAVAGLEAAFGVHPGQRRNHAKGTCAIGSFVGTPAASGFSRSKLFSGQPVPVVARFSIPGGHPDAADTDRSPRGFAIELRLPDGARHHFTMLDIPTFFTAKPEGFIERMQEIAAHAAPPSKRLPPASYASAPYFAIHTFHAISADGHTTLVKFRFVPDDGVKSLTEDELAAAPHDFLEAKLIERLRQGPVKWHLIVTLGAPGDNETDATVAWPANRPEIDGGTLSLTSATPGPGGVCEPINYDPLVMADGIAPSADPVLLFRAGAYKQSAALRLQGK